MRDAGAFDWLHNVNGESQFAAERAQGDVAAAVAAEREIGTDDKARHAQVRLQEFDKCRVR